MKTPDEARQTWCPYVVALAMRPNRKNTDFETLPPHNRTIDEHGNSFTETSRCIADDCSQWVWTHESKVKGKTHGFCGRNTAMALKVFGR